MNINALLNGFVENVVDCEILSLALDSRKVTQGALFVAQTAEQDKREQYIAQAISFGASVILYPTHIPLNESEQLLIDEKVAAYPVDDLMLCVSEIAARFYGEPSKEITVVAVTGTNGKTSVSHFIAQALKFLDVPCAMIGTLGVGQLDALQDSGMTTPDPIKMQAVLSEFKQQGIEVVVMEASSHALAQNRLAAVDIDIAVFTNLTRDHLDYHGDMQSYGEAKQRLFEFDSIQTAVINKQDDFGKKLIALCEQRAVSTYKYSQGEAAETQHQVVATSIQLAPSGISFDLHCNDKVSHINSSLFGQFNVDNLSACCSTLMALGYDFEKATSAVSSIQAVNGRMQQYQANEQAAIVIDFAHTPDALTQALLSLKKHLSTEGKLWCVFGCGGDRDKGKRAQMGEAAESVADKLVITSDNPRSESNELIVIDILAGLSKPTQAYVEHDRTKAIELALREAESTDLILVAGKGHETYQEIQGVKYPYSDKKVVTSLLKAANDASHKMMRVSL